jgi:hypothetical protein
MAYTVYCGLTRMAKGLRTLEIARELIRYDLGCHPEIPGGVGWAWNLDVLEACNAATGAVLYTIRVIADP